MTVRTVLPLVSGLSMALCLGADPNERVSEKPPHVYTNDDLERIHPYRDELGASSVPAMSAADQRKASRDVSGTPRKRSEEYWRREAEKVRDRVRTLRDQAQALQDRLAQQEAEKRRANRTGGRSSSVDTGVVLRTRLAAIERRIRELEEDLVDRGRREGALPGWLR